MKISLVPDATENTLTHELAHLIDFGALPRGGDASKHQMGSLNQVFPDIEYNPSDEKVHSKDAQEVYAALKSWHMRHGLLTAKDIKNLKSTHVDFRGARHRGVEDLRQALRRNRKSVEALSDQDIADILNQVAVRQPKAKRGEPTQAIAESLMNRIDAKLDAQHSFTEVTRMYRPAHDEKIQGYRGAHGDTGGAETQARSTQDAGRRSQGPRRSEPRSGTHTRRNPARGPRRKAPRERRAKDTADKLARKWAPRFEPETQVTDRQPRKRAPRPASKPLTAPPGRPRPSGFLNPVPTELKTVTPASIEAAEAANAVTKKAARKTALKKAARSALRQALPWLGALEGAADVYKYGKWAQPGWAEQGAIVDAPEYLQTGEGYPVDPRDPEWDPEEPIKGEGWGLGDIDWSPEELLRPFLPRKGHTGGYGLSGTPEWRDKRARELSNPVRESIADSHGEPTQASTEPKKRRKIRIRVKRK